MSYGGLLSTVIDPFGIGDPSAPKAPNANKVGRDYLALVGAFNQAQPSIFQTEQTFKPQYTGLDLQNLNSVLNGVNGTPGFLQQIQGANSAQRTANLSDWQKINPGGSGLLDQLTQSASDQLGAGSRIAPEDSYRITNSVRSDWANRGLGGSLPAGLDEALQLFGGGENLRQSRQNFAGNVAGMNQSQAAQLFEPSQAPFAAQAFSQGAGPTIMPAAQSYDMFNTVYNARAANNIAASNNAAAADSY